MAAGHGAALHDVLRGKSDEDLEVLVTGEARLGVQVSDPALDYLGGLRRGTSAIVGRAVPARPLPAAPSPGEDSTRLTLAPGVEVHIRRGARPPNSRLEQERLARALLDALDRLRSRP